MKLKLKDFVFDVTGATLSASLPDPYWCDTYNDGEGKELFWSLDIPTVQQEIDGQIWQPRIYHESLSFPVRQWKDVSGQAIRWTQEFNDETGEPNGGFYVFEHGDIPQGALQIGDLSADGFKIRWDGVCNIFWNEEYGANVPFDLQAVASFEGIRVAGTEHETEAILRDRLARYLEPDDFEQQPLVAKDVAYQSGVKMVDCLFKPLAC